MNRVSGPDTAKPSDVIGVLLWGLLSFVGVVVVFNGGTDTGLAGVAMLFISVCLFIPGWHYHRGTIRVVGFVVLGLAAAASVTGAVASGWFAFRCWSELQGDRLLIEAIAAAFFVFSAFAAGCAAVMVKKLRARPARAGTAVALGIAAGLVYVLLWHWL